MGFWQRLITSVVSKERAADMEAESRDWTLRCPCGHESSVWELGGVRYGGRSRGKRSMIKCRACGKRTWHSWYRKSEGRPAS